MGEHDFNYCLGDEEDSFGVDVEDAVVVEGVDVRGRGVG